MHHAELPSGNIASNPDPQQHPTETAARRRLRRVCAWCKRMALDGLEWADDRWSPRPDAAVTHGICPRCAARFE